MPFTVNLLVKQRYAATPLYLHRDLIRVSNIDCRNGRVNDLEFTVNKGNPCQN